jgi:hypothetical protein
MAVGAASGDPPMNYHILASAMASQPALAIFRLFHRSQIRDLLRLQGEILSLESELDSIIKSDRASGNPEREEFEFCIASLKGPPHPSLENGLQWQKQVELGQKLSYYRQSLPSQARPFWLVRCSC